MFIFKKNNYHIMKNILMVSQPDNRNFRKLSRINGQIFNIPIQKISLNCANVYGFWVKKDADAMECTFHDISVSFYLCFLQLGDSGRICDSPSKI